MYYTRVCSLADCKAEFQTDNSRKMHCSPAHSNLDRVRRHRRNRKGKGGGGGGGGGNGGGGGESPTLFDAITPVDSRAIYVPDTCYRTPEAPKRKPVTPTVTDNSQVAA